ncbi:ParA family protein [Spiribacter halobius]|uniref:ParA family protein n=1 Tax=Sediminicurvatus halobius TaxID=2182432 RepID=A0A2U2N9X3_9GAMM|nr:ParA family protein [Spiribacter halobius]PWG65774.1 ParA family protein [Spiribacter halobius]UEX77814.1 ParA family protein [Spiribacter halobius]
MKVLAVYSLKGGVGKTAAAVNLAWQAARGGLPTLLWDLDAQGAATWCLGVEPGLDQPARKLLGRKSPLGREIRPTRFPALELLPADASLRHLDRELDKGSDGAERLRRMVQPLSETAGLLVLDCPPSFSRLAEAVVRLADTVLVPVIPTPLARNAWLQMRGHFDRGRYGRGKLLPFLSMVDRRRGLHRAWSDHPPEGLEDCLRAWIPYASQVEQMSVQRAPLGHFAPRAAVSHAYAGLWRALARRTGIDGRA